MENKKKILLTGKIAEKYILLQKELKEKDELIVKLKENQKQKKLFSSSRDDGNPWASGDWVDAY